MSYIYNYQVLGSSSKKGAIVVKEGDDDPCGKVTTIVFNGSDETVVIDGATAYINGVAPPPNLGGSNLTDNITLYSGRLSQSNINYRAGDPAGNPYQGLQRMPDQFSLQGKTIRRYGRG